MKIDFYYWSYQCPLNNEMLKLLKRYENSFDIYYHDISIEKEQAQRLKIFFPTLTVVDDVQYYYNPLTPDFLEQLVQGQYPIEKPYRPYFCRNEFHVDISPITFHNIDFAGACTGKAGINCVLKKEFLDNFGLEIYGFINHDGNKLLGGVEYVPSLVVPYDIDKDQFTAFITCVYSPYLEFDAKTAPLRRLEDYLKDKFNRVVVICDEKGNFPNGDMEFFIQNDYKDCGILLKEDYCTLHLMEKYLK